MVDDPILRSCRFSLSWRRGRLSWSGLFVGPQSFHSCFTRSMSLFAGRTGRSHPYRCAEAASHGPDFLVGPVSFTSCWTRCSMSLLHRSCRTLSWCRCRFPWSTLFVGPWRFLVCLRQGDRCPCCAGRASSLCRRGGDSRLGVSTASCGMKLALGSGRALCTGTGPGCDPRHQGGEGVAGSPGLTPS